MTTITTTHDEGRLIAAYLGAIYFTEDKAGCFLDHDFFRESVIDCLSFYGRIACYLSDDQLTQAGHDFWLTRNGHGAGFWDGDWPTHGAMFDRIAQSYGEVDAVWMDD